MPASSFGKLLPWDYIAVVLHLGNHNLVSFFQIWCHRVSGKIQWLSCVFCKYNILVRIGIYEILEVSDPIRKLIMKNANADEIREAARAQGMTTMLEDGFSKAVAGITSIAELLRVIHD